MTSQVDLITFEVLRHRLWEINDEMGILAARISGSPVVYESADFNCAILTAEGRGLFTGVYIIRQAAALDVLIQSVIERFTGDIQDGDMFMTNDPWCGALHAMDYAVVAPVCWDGKIVAWTGIVMHEMDVGGPRPGSWTVGARDAYAECPLMPPVKIVEGGKLRKDIEAVFLRNSRTADINALNLRGKIAAQISARERLLDIIREYGIDTFLAVQEQVLEHVRTSVRKRISKLPDGTWYGNAFLDHDGVDNHLYRLRLKLTKSKDRFTFDFTGTAKQARGPINCAYSGLVGGITQVLFPLLCFDIPWSHGAVLDCIDIISEEGTINNATFPAATSMSTVNACTATGNLIWEAMARMYGCCEELRDEVIALGYGGVNLGVLSGQRQDGRRFVNLFSDSVGGGGAKATREGVNTSGSLNSPSYGIPNVERIEGLIPVLYAYRRERSETAGAGTRRGGVGLEFMIVPHGIDSDLDAVFFATGVTHLIPKGINGGSAGSVQQNFVARKTDVHAQLAAGRIPQSLDELTCERVDLQEAKAATTISPRDAWVNFCCGGGGYGDPLVREPERCARDVKIGQCTREEVERLYGVFLHDDGSADAEATAERRRAMLAARFQAGVTLGAKWRGSFEGRQLFRYAETLAVRETAGGATLGCLCCGEALCPAEEDPRQRALMIEVPLAALSALNAYQPSDVVHRSYACPTCATIFSSDVQLRTEDPRMPEMHLRLTG